MKKILFVFIFILSFLIMGYNYISEETGIPFVSNNENEYRESYNSEKNMNLARNIAAMAKAEKVAVIGNEKRILVGISMLSSPDEKNRVKKWTENLIREEYKSAEIEIEIETNGMQKIFDLTKNAEEGLSGKALNSKMKDI